MQQLLQAFGGPGRTALGFAPAYSMHPIIARGTGTALARRPARRADFSARPRRRRARPIARAPAATWSSSARRTTPPARRSALEWSRPPTTPRPGLVVVDEAYAEFAPRRHAERPGPARGPAAARGHPHHEQGLRARRWPAGLPRRDPGAVVDALRLVRLPYHLSALTQAVARAALAHAGPLLATVEAIKRQRDRIVAELTALGLDRSPTATRTSCSSAASPTSGHLAGPARPGRPRPRRRPPRLLRVTAGTPTETDAFLTAMGRLAAAHRQEQSA